MTSKNDATNDQAPPEIDFHTILTCRQQNQEWQGRAAVTMLHKWTGILNNEFKLELPGMAYRVDELPVTQMGSFRGEHNGLGIEREVTLNTLYLRPDRPRWEPFATLLHQLLHAWQHARGVSRPTYVHDAVYRRKAIEIGLMVSPKGLTCCVNGGPFVRLLERNGIAVEGHLIVSSDAPEENAPAQLQTTKAADRLKGSSKLRKYSCGCTSVRVAQKKFRALCLNCGNEFLACETDTNSDASDTEEA
jgi:hypothetical protein